jgi:hypothetical protein
MHIQELVVPAQIYYRWDDGEPPTQKYLAHSLIHQDFLLERLILSIGPATDQVDLEIGNLNFKMNQQLALFRR